VKRSEEVSFPKSEAPTLLLDVQSSLLSVTGSDSQNYEARLCAEAGAASQDEATALLERIRLTRAGNTLKLSSPSFNSREEQSSAIVRMTAPRDAPMNISGTYAALAVHDMSAPLKLTTTHARITVLETTGDVDAEVKEFGIIDFSGTRGHIRLDAPTEINLNFTGQKFDGTLSAKSDWTIRVLLPKGFASSFEADVTKNSNFICRGDICSHVQRNAMVVSCSGTA
jgi:hypothetical protein